MTILGAALAFLFLDPPARYIVIGLLLLIDVFEIAVWLRWRKRRSQTGPEGLLGAAAEVIYDCGPDGQVKLKGQIWSAHCATGAERGDLVRVTSVEGLRLVVTRVDEVDRSGTSLHRSPGGERTPPDGTGP